MTENKRFTIDFDNRMIIDNEHNENLKYLIDFKETLNELNEENEQLKSENRQLKGRIMEYEEQIGDVE